MRFIQHSRRVVPLAFAILVTAQANPLHQAGMLIDEGRYAEAKKILAPLSNSPDPEVAFLLGRLASLADHDDEKAQEYFQKAVAKKPNDARYHYWLGRAYGDQAEKASIFRQASLAGKTRDEFERAVALDPNFIDARKALIEYYTLAPSLMGGSEEKALQQAAEIKKRDPLEGHVAYATIYSRQKKPDLVRKEYVDAVREQPNSPKAHYLLGILLMGTDRNYPAAFQEYDAALKLDPNYMPAYFQIGHTAALANANLARGEESLKKYLGWHPEEDDPPLFRAYYWLGYVCERMGKRAEAKQNYEKSLNMRPGQKDVQERTKAVQ